MAMKVVRQARLELSGGSTPDQLRPLSLTLGGGVPNAAGVLWQGGVLALLMGPCEATSHDRQMPLLLRCCQCH